MHDAFQANVGDLPGLLRMTLAACAAQAKLAMPHGVSEPWVELAVRAGPVTRLGALTHNILVPARRPKPEIGLNVFSHDASTPFDEIVLGWARRWLGSDKHVHGLLSTTGVRFHAGFAFGADELRLTLYASEGLELLAARLGMQLGKAIGVAVDVTQAGIENARRYLAVAGFEREDDWPDPQPSCSHRMLTVVESRRMKTTRSTTFLPGAPLSELFAVARSIGDQELDVELLERLLGIADEHGLSLSAVAHEMNEVADRKRDSDALVAVCVR
jgi:hypothetical protein